MTREEIEARYLDLLGRVPDTTTKRLDLAERVGRLDAVYAIEAFRDELLHRNPLDRKTQQLVHFAMLIGAGQTEPATLHARGAMKAGATAADLFGVCETAAVVGGMVAFSRAVSIVTKVTVETETEN